MLADFSVLPKEGHCPCCYGKLKAGDKTPEKFVESRLSQRRQNLREKVTGKYISAGRISKFPTLQCGRGEGRWLLLVSVGQCGKENHWTGSDCACWKKACLHGDPSGRTTEVQMGQRMSHSSWTEIIDDHIRQWMSSKAMTYGQMTLRTRFCLPPSLPVHSHPSCKICNIK